MSVVHADPF